MPEARSPIFMVVWVVKGIFITPGVSVFVSRKAILVHSVPFLFVQVRYGSMVSIFTARQGRDISSFFFLAIISPSVIVFGKVSLVILLGLLILRTASLVILGIMRIVKFVPRSYRLKCPRWVQSISSSSICVIWLDLSVWLHSAS